MSHFELKQSPISQSNIFVGAGGDGVLFFHVPTSSNPNGDGTISEKREYVFTEWDPTATSDMAALKTAFDTNGDGKLSGAELTNFKVMVTKADGSTEVKTLAELGITEINLNVDATEIRLPDGSVITGQSSFTRADGTTGIAADVSLVAETQGHRVVQTTSVDASGTRTVTSKAYDAGGTLVYVITSVTNATGTSVTNSYDVNGDGVVDQLQTITSGVVNGETVETLTSMLKMAA